MITYDNFLANPDFAQWQEQFKKALEVRCEPKRWGDKPTWESALALLPDVVASKIDLNQDDLGIGAESDLTTEQHEQLIEALRIMMPWRKGPFNFFGTYLDCEWRSDWKWQRIKPHLSDLNGKKVLDVGCGTGYHSWRALGDGASYVMGIDPSMRFVYQHAMAQKYIQSDQFDFLPLGIEDMPTDLNYFDTVFSMGVLYHRKNPDNHLAELYSLLNSGGELVLETLIVDEDFEKVENGIFVPEDRYAKMRNVWSLATVPYLIEHLKLAGFENVRCVDINTTSMEEQRSTEWMTFHSLKDFLDPLNPQLTVEGHPAPVRASLIAQKP